MDQVLSIRFLNGTKPGELSAKVLDDCPLLRFFAFEAVDVYRLQAELHAYRIEYSAPVLQVGLWSGVCPSLAR